MIHLKRQLGANQPAWLCVHEPIADAAVDGLPWGDHKDTLAPSPLCGRRRRINEADFSSPVALDQRDSSCLDEAVR